MSNQNNDENWNGYQDILLPLGHKDDVNNLSDLAPLLNKEGGTIHLLHIMIEGKYSKLPREWRIASRRISESHHALMRKGIASETHMVTAKSLTGGILSQAEESDCDLILLGWGPRPKSSISKLITKVMSNADCDVIVFKARSQPEEIKEIVYPVALKPDDRRLRLIGRLMENTGAKLTFAHVARPGKDDWNSAKKMLKDLQKITLDIGIESDTRLCSNRDPVEELIDISSDYDLMVLGPSRGWWLNKALFGHKTDHIASSCHCSVLMHKNPE